VTTTDDFLAHGAWLAYSVVSPSGRFLATSTSDHQVLIWDLGGMTDDGKPKAEKPKLPPIRLRVPEAYSGLRFSSDSKELRTCIHNRVLSWKLPTGPTSRFKRNWSQGVVNGVFSGGSFNSDGTRAVFLSKSPELEPVRRLLAWDVEANRELWRYEEQADGVYGAPVFGPKGRYIAARLFKAHIDANQRLTTVDSKLLVLDGDTGQNIRTFAPEREDAWGIDIRSPLFNPAGTHIAALIDYRYPDKPDRFEVVLWDIRTGEQVFAVNIDDASPNLNFFSHDGRELMIGQGATGGLLVLDARTGAKRRIIAPEGTALIKSGHWSLSPDGSTLAALGLQDQEREIAVAFFDAVTGKPGLTIPLVTEQEPWVMTWSPDGRRLALGSGRRPQHYPEVTIWDTDTGRLLLTLTYDHYAQIGRNDSALRFSSDGYRLMHITSDNRLFIGNSDQPLTLHPIQIWDATPLVER
jgi:WD40 repeat protein